MAFPGLYPIIRTKHCPHCKGVFSDAEWETHVAKTEKALARLTPYVRAAQKLKGRKIPVVYWYSDWGKPALHRLTYVTLESLHGHCSGYCAHTASLDEIEATFDRKWFHVLSMKERLDRPYIFARHRTIDLQQLDYCYQESVGALFVKTTRGATVTPYSEERGVYRFWSNARCNYEDNGHNDQWDYERDVKPLREFFLSKSWR